MPAKIKRNRFIPIYNNKKPPSMVDLKGFEPLTPCLQSRCSNQLSYRPSVDGGFDLRRNSTNQAWECQ